MKTLWICIFIVLLSVFSGFTLVDHEIKDIAFPREASYNVGFASFIGKNLSVENKYLINSIPLLLFEGIEELTTHTITLEQKEAYQKAVIMEEIQKLIKNIELKQQERDMLVFKLEQEKINNKIKEQINKEIENYLKQVNELRSYDFHKIKIPQEIDVKYIKDNNQLTLIMPPAYSPLQYMKEKKIDLLVYGIIEEIENYLYLEINIFDSLLEKMVYSYKDTSLSEDIISCLSEIKKELAFNILGRSWASVRIKAEPSTAYIYVNGEFAGIGESDIAYLKTGKSSVLISHPDYIDQEIEIVLSDNEEKEVAIFLDKHELGVLRISSLPEQADLYANSVWIGKTPLDVELSMNLKRLIIKKDGYSDYAFHIGNKESGSITIQLDPDLTDKAKKQEKKRDEFYFALGLWFVSIPMPAFLGGLVNEYDEKIEYSDKEGPVYEQNARLRDIFYFSYYGAFVLNFALLTNLFFNLYFYIKSADRPIG